MFLRQANAVLIVYYTERCMLHATKIRRMKEYAIELIWMLYISQVIITSNMPFWRTFFITVRKSIFTICNWYSGMNNASIKHSTNVNCWILHFLPCWWVNTEWESIDNKTTNNVSALLFCVYRTRGTWWTSMLKYPLLLAVKLRSPAMPLTFTIYNIYKNYITCCSLNPLSHCFLSHANSALYLYNSTRRRSVELNV